MSTHDVTVVVPVYRGLEDTRRALSAIMSTCGTAETAATVLVVNDASPEPELTAYLRDLAEEPGHVHLELLENTRNLGFTATVNRAMAACTGDAVIVNADAVVTEGWLDSMVATARSVSGVATVTPLTNFGSICTIPATLLPVQLRDESMVSRNVAAKSAITDFAATLRRLDLGLRPELISGVGFCMLIARRAWETVGPFDVATFGVGYGEEVDFCLRATRMGFVHLADTSTYVHHRGGGSFGDEQRAARIAASSAVLRQRYPWFRGVNLAWQATQPLGPVFAALRLDAAPRDSSRLHVLHVLHSPPDETGGTEGHLAALVDGMRDEIDATILHPGPNGSFVARTFWHSTSTDLDQHEFLFPAAARSALTPRDRVAESAFDLALLTLAPDIVHVQNLIGHSIGLPAVAAARGVPVVLSLRDQYPVCPHHWLMYRNIVNCGVPEDLSICGSCLPATKGESHVPLTEHRQAFAEALEHVDRIVVASQNSGDWLREAYPISDERVIYIEHGAIVDMGLRAPVRRSWEFFDEPLRVAGCGQARKKKGADILSWLADDVTADGIEVHHFGQLLEPLSDSVVAHGAYSGDQLVTLLRAGGIHVVVLVAPYAETFGHVMTEAMIAGCPVIVSEFGSLAERVWRHGTGWTVDPDDPGALAQLVRRLDDQRGALESVARVVEELPIDHTSETVHRYAQLYEECSATGDPMRIQDEDIQRHLRALANHQRHLQITSRDGSGDAASKKEVRAIAKTLRSRDREIARLKEAYAESRQEARSAKQELASVVTRRSVRSVLKVVKLFGRD